VHERLQRWRETLVVRVRERAPAEVGCRCRHYAGAVPARSARHWKEEAPTLKQVPGGEGGAVQECVR
jgi:hypothetical protein